MKYIINHSNDTAFNIALEEYAFKHLLDEDQIFLLWINKPSIIVGRHQNTIEEINRDYVREHGIEVVRRISGGGAVYHDLNNLNYTIISKEDENKAFDFKSFSTPVINTLAELGVKAEFTGRNDLEIDGKKFCGNAQAYINGRIMHHGCLLFDVDLSVLANALKVSKDKFESKGVKSVRARVTNIIDELPEKITVEEFRDLLLDYMKKEYPEMTEYVFSDEELAEINRIKDTKFGTWDLSVLANALKVSKDKFESKGVKSVRARVTNIIDELPEKITVEEFRDLLLDYMKKEYPEMTEYVFSDEELAEINRIKDTKFGTWDWNYGKSPEYNVRRGTKFPSGKVEIFANVIESKIQDIKIYGDFFGIEDVAAVEDVLRGVKYEREDVLKALQTINLGRYFAGITAEEIAEAVVE